MVNTDVLGLYQMPRLFLDRL